ncbi:MAG TPA: DUF1127 domain-containing protein [Kiloniellales bacterium]|nr:DUF1127 domain-containing protein [Kiloniellales bacterium]
MLAAAGTALFAASGFLQRSLKRAFGGICRKRRGRRSIDALRALDDRLLADMGVDRCSIGFAACHGRLPRRHVPLTVRAGNVVELERAARHRTRVA